MPELPATVVFQRAGDIALICVDNPPVNALSGPVIAGLDQALAAFEQDPHVTFAILYCAGRGFIAGADIREPPSRERSNAAAALINRLAASAKPILAAIHGRALGGGLEIALACDYRCATEDAGFGLPEVNIGAVPGYGGTQRLPRALGMEAALNLMLTGEPMDAQAALRMGLIDRLLAGSLLAGALEFAQELLALKAPGRKLDIRSVPDASSGDAVCAAALTRMAAERPLEDAPPIIIECVRRSVTLPLDEGLAFERRQSLTRLEAPQCLAMRYQFFAERLVRKRDCPQDLRRQAAGRMLEALGGEVRLLLDRGVTEQALRTAFDGFGWKLPSKLPLPERASPTDQSSVTLVDARSAVHRCLNALARAGRNVCAEHEELKPEDLDFEFCHAWGFPRFRGGPMYLARLEKTSPAPTQRNRP